MCRTRNLNFTKKDFCSSRKGYAGPSLEIPSETEMGKFLELLDFLVCMKSINTLSVKYFIDLHKYNLTLLSFTMNHNTVVISIQLIERFNGRLPGYLGQGNDKYSFSHVDDVVEGHIAAMHKGRVGERYLLTGENASFVDVFDTAADITGTRRPIFNIPLWLIEAYGHISVFISRITGKLPLISPPVRRRRSFPFQYFCSLCTTFMEIDCISLVLINIDIDINMVLLIRNNRIVMNFTPTIEPCSISRMHRISD